MRSEVRRVKLADIAAPVPNAIAAGPFGSNLVSRDYVESGVPVIRGQNLASRWVAGQFVFVSATKAEQLRTNTAKPGDIVFTQRGTLGQVSVVPAAPFCSYVVSQSQMKLTVNHSAADPRYVYYACTAPDFVAQVHNNSVAAGVPHINLGILRGLEIPLPPMPMQAVAADVLAALDDRIDLLRQTSATLESIAQALFKSWFMDFDPVRAKAEGREPDGMDAATAALFPAEFEESALGLTPKGWGVTKLGDYLELTKGCSYKGEGLSEADGAHMFNLGCFNAHRVFASEKVKRYTGEYRPRHAVVPGDLIMANTDMTQARDILGRPAFVPDGFDPGFISHHVFKVTVKTSDHDLAGALRLFLFFALQQDYFRERAIGFATGTTVLALPATTVTECPSCMPPDNALVAFSGAARPLLERIRFNEKHADTLADARDEMLPRLISGKLSLAEAQAQLEKAIA